MDSNIVVTLFIALLGISVTGNGLLWYKMGKLERAIKSVCPFGQCPLFKRAEKEARTH